MNQTTHQAPENANYLLRYLSGPFEGYNRFAILMYSELIQDNPFPNPEIPLSLFWEALEMFHQNLDLPLKGYTMFIAQLEEGDYSLHQKLFICKWLGKCLYANRFEDGDRYESTRVLLESHCKKLRTVLQISSDSPTGSIREKLRYMVSISAEKLLNDYENIDREDSLKLLTHFAPMVIEKENAAYTAPNTSAQNAGEGSDLP